MRVFYSFSWAHNAKNNSTPCKTVTAYCHSCWEDQHADMWAWGGITLSQDEVERCGVLWIYFFVLAFLLSSTCVVLHISLSCKPLQFFLLSMADKQSFKWRAASGLSILLLGAILAFSVYTWYTPEADLLPRSIVAWHTGNLDLQGTPEHLSILTLEWRQSFQCGADNPCSNGACCGGSGYCGYDEPFMKETLTDTWSSCLTGPTYCESGCVSNCGAVVECGQYTATAGTQCSLNTCCSQYGFVSLWHASITDWIETDTWTTVQHNIRLLWKCVSLSLFFSSMVKVLTDSWL